MASPTLLLAQHLGLDVYGNETSELALSTVLRIRQIFPAKQSCLVGGMAVVHHVGKQSRPISPDLDLMISISSPNLIARHFQTSAKTFGVSIDCGQVAVNCMATTDPMERDIIETSQIANMAGSLIRVASIGSMLALKFRAGRVKDFEDIRLLLSVSKTKPDHNHTLDLARHLLQSHHKADLKAFESLLSAFETLQ